MKTVINIMYPDMPPDAVTNMNKEYQAMCKTDEEVEKKIAEDKQEFLTCFDTFSEFMDNLTGSEKRFIWLRLNNVSQAWIGHHLEIVHDEYCQVLAERYVKIEPEE